MHGNCKNFYTGVSRTPPPLLTQPGYAELLARFVDLARHHFPYSRSYRLRRIPAVTPQM